jgi:predicted amidophosphoribosyltransferase
MTENTCVCCGEIIPEGRQVCWNCEHRTTRVGQILQSQNATLDEINNAYTSLNTYKEE